MIEKLVYIPNVETQNYPFRRLQLVIKRLDTQLNETTNHNLIKDNPKMLSQQISKRCHKTLGTSAINSQMSPTSLPFCATCCFS